MNKKQINVANIISHLTTKNIKFTVLNTINGSPQHIRIEGFGDCYPATGTWLDSDGGWHRKDVQGFITATSSLSSTDCRLSYDDLLIKCSMLESELEAIKCKIISIQNPKAPAKIKPEIQTRSSDRVSQAIERGAEARRQGKPPESNYYAGLNQPILFGHWQAGYNNTK